MRRYGRWMVVVAVLLLVAVAYARLTPGSGPPPASRATRSATPSEASDGYTNARKHMVDTQMRARGIQDARVLTAMEAVRRHEFVPADMLDQAYSDYPLPIGYGQTISQPYIVAVMTQLLEMKPNAKVLEIGTGSGYQAAVLAELTDRVYSIEIVPQLAERTRAAFDRLGYQRIHTRTGDGYWGWPDEAPFDAIMVTAAPDHVPQPLLEQLVDGGRMVIPVGPPGGYQSLWVITRQGDEYQNVNWGGVAFVPLTRAAE